MSFRFCAFILSFSLFLSINLQLLGQKSPRISYFTKDGSLAELEEAFYYRQSTDTLNFYRSYYVASKNTYFKGSIISANDSLDKNNKYSGTCIWFYPNGNKLKEYNYDEKGLLNGICKEYYENGDLKKEVEFYANKPKSKKYIAYNLKRTKSIVYEENFSTNENNWDTINEMGSSKLKLGGIELTGKKNVNFIAIPAIKVNSPNYMLEVSINSNYLRDTMLKAGFVFEYKNASNYYYYYISHNKRYIGKVQDGKYIKIIDGFFSIELNPYDINKIQVSRIGNKIYYAANGSILLCHYENDSIQNKFGLSVKGIGFVLFDNLLVHEYEKNVEINAIFLEKKYMNLKSENFGIRSFSTGLVLNKNGLIVTTLDYFKNHNNIEVQVYINDTLKNFTAIIAAKDPYHNLAFLQLQNLGTSVLDEPYYTFFKKPAIKVGDFLSTSCFTEQQFDTIKPTSVLGKLKSPALFENFSTYFETDISGGQHITGAPVFTLEGELLGIINQVALNSSTIKLTHIINLIFAKQEQVEKYRTPNLKNIYKNVVNIRVR